jgi:hypothetical protein
VHHQLMGRGSVEFLELDEDLILGHHEVDVHEAGVVVNEQDEVTLVVD